MSPLPVDQHVDDLVELLGDAVAKRLRSDLPVGVFLSGCIDSSTVAALAARHSARQVAEMYGTEHHHEFFPRPGPWSCCRR